MNKIYAVRRVTTDVCTVNTVHCLTGTIRMDINDSCMSTSAPHNVRWGPNQLYKSNTVTQVHTCITAHLIMCSSNCMYTKICKNILSYPNLCNSSLSSWTWAFALSRSLATSEHVLDSSWYCCIRVCSCACGGDNDTTLTCNHNVLQHVFLKYTCKSNKITIQQ